MVAFPPHGHQASIQHIWVGSRSGVDSFPRASRCSAVSSLGVLLDGGHVSLLEKKNMWGKGKEGGACLVKPVRTKKKTKTLTSGTVVFL